MIEIVAVVAIVCLFAAILLPTLMSIRANARELAREASDKSASVETPAPTVEDMEEAAEEATEEHDIYDRVVALTENLGTRRLEIRVYDGERIINMLLQSDGDMESVRVYVDGKKVYKQVDDDILIYLGMGEWEHLLGEIETVVETNREREAAEREENFRIERERRFGPLPGWDTKINKDS